MIQFIIFILSQFVREMNFNQFIAAQDRMLYSIHVFFQKFETFMRKQYIIFVKSPFSSQLIYSIMKSRVHKPAQKKSLNNPNSLNKQQNLKEYGEDQFQIYESQNDQSRNSKMLNQNFPEKQQSENLNTITKNNQSEINKQNNYSSEKIEKKQKMPEQNDRQVVSERAGKEKSAQGSLNDRSKENSIKETINRLTKNILNTRNEIVNQISSINKFRESGQNSFKSGSSWDAKSGRSSSSKNDQNPLKLPKIASKQLGNGREAIHQSYMKMLQQEIKQKKQNQKLTTGDSKEIQEKNTKSNNSKNIRGRVNTQNKPKASKSFKQIRDALYASIEPSARERKHSQPKLVQYTSLKNISILNRERQQKLRKENPEQKQERKRKHQIYLQQKSQRKEERDAEKEMKKKLIKERVAYEQKYFGKNTNRNVKQYYEREIDRQEIEAFENEFIARIKARFSKMKSEPKQQNSKMKSLEISQNKVSKEKELLKLAKQNKFKEKINLKLKLQQDVPESRVYHQISHSDEIHESEQEEEDENNLDQERNPQSAPNLQINENPSMGSISKSMTQEAFENKVSLEHS